MSPRFNEGINKYKVIGTINNSVIGRLQNVAHDENVGPGSYDVKDGIADKATLKKLGYAVNQKKGVYPFVSSERESKGPTSDIIDQPPLLGATVKKENNIVSYQ